MTFKHGAIPTVYKGIQFRSRTEARWAAFFDRVGWVWEYEPYDLSGWIPDFAIRLRSGERLVEVKASGSFDELAKFAGTKQLAHAPEGTLLLGSAPMVADVSWPGGPRIDGLAIGLVIGRIDLFVDHRVVSKEEMDLHAAVNHLAIARDMPWPEQLSWQAALLDAVKIPYTKNLVYAENRETPFLCGCGSTMCLEPGDCVCGVYTSSREPDTRDFIQRAWAAAQNATQWKRRT